MSRKSKRKFQQEVDKKILIVTEGETEINYINFLVDKYGVKKEKIKIIKGGVPTTVLRKAKDEQKKEKKRRYNELGYDDVYCVIDKDRHKKFEQVKNEIKEIEDFQAIISIPCLEFWFLLHYEYSRSGYYQGGDLLSPCKECIKKLKYFYPSYGKTDKKFFKKIENDIDKAKRHAKSIMKEIKGDKKKNTGDDGYDPSTEMYVLVEKLQDMGKV